MRMNGCAYGRLVAVWLAAILLAPAAMAVAPTGGEGTGGIGQRAAPDHMRSIALNDLSGMQTSKLAAWEGGGVGLGLGEGSWKPEFAVDSISGQNKSNPAVVAISGNDLIIAWDDYRKGASDTDIYAQHYDPRGNPVGGEIAVSTAAAQQGYPCVAADAQGGFMVAWYDARSGTGSDIFAQRFDRNGNKAGGEVQVSASGAAIIPKMASNANGDFLVTWYDNRNVYSTRLDIYAQMLDANGTKKGTEIAVTTAPQNQEPVCVASDSKNRFIIAWEDGRSGSNDTIYAQRIDGNGNKLGSEIMVSNSPSYQSSPSVAVYPNDDFVIGWIDRRTGHNNICARRFDPNGTPLGGEMSTTASQYDKDFDVIAVNSSFYSFICWMDWRATNGDIYGQWFDPGGSQFGPEVIIASAAAQQWKPAIARDLKDDIAITWLDWRSGTQGDVYARLMAYPYQSPGTITTGDINGTDVWAWSTVTAGQTLHNSSGNSISFNVSTDSGTSWLPVPANGSLAAAGAAQKIRIRATLSTTDDMSTPVLYNMTVAYLSDLAPAAALSASLSSVLLGQQVQFNASASADPEGAALSYNFSFGDGSDSGWVATPAVQHAYSSAGGYNVTVAVKDDLGAVNSSAAVMITVVKPVVPTLTVTDPKEGRQFNATALAVTFTVADYTISTTAGHIHYQLDNLTEVMWFSAASFSLGNLTDGSHILKVYLADANHTRLSNPEASVQVNFTVQLPPMPDIAVSAADLKLKPSSPRDGDTVTISVTVHNSGNLDAGAFAVRFFVDSTALPDQNVVLLAKGGSTVVQAKWKATSGSHAISVKVNPGGGLQEGSMANNEAAKTVKVEKKQTAAEFPWLLVAVAIIVVAIVAVLAMVMMRPKPTVVLPYQPPQAPAAQAPPPPTQTPMPPQLPQIPPPVPPPQP